MEADKSHNLSARWEPRKASGVIQWPEGLDSSQTKSLELGVTKAGENPCSSPASRE